MRKTAPLIALVCVTAALLVLYVRSEQVPEGLRLAREAQTLTLDMACALAKDYFVTVRGPTKDEFSCTGTLTPGDGVTRLDGYSVNRVGLLWERQVTVCLARAHRWYVVETIPGDEVHGQCTGQPPIPATRPNSEVAFRGQEAALRAEQTRVNDSRFRAEDATRQQRSRELVAELPSKLQALRAAVLPKVHDPRLRRQGTCTVPMDTALEQLQYVDLDALEGSVPAREERWGFLTSSSFRAALDESQTLEERGSAAFKSFEATSYIVVFSANPGSKVWPTFDQANGVSKGRFVGWATLVGTSSGKPECETPIEFANVASVEEIERRERALAVQVKEAELKRFLQLQLLATVLKVRTAEQDKRVVDLTQRLSDAVQEAKEAKLDEGAALEMDLERSFDLEAARAVQQLSHDRLKIDDGTFEAWRARWR